MEAKHGAGLPLLTPEINREREREEGEVVRMGGTGVLILGED